MTAGIEAISSLNRAFADLVRGGRCVFLPRRLEVVTTEEVDGILGEAIYAPPLLDSLDRLLPLNRVAYAEDLSHFFVYKNIVLPYFPNLSFVALSRLTDDVTESFVRFNHFLRNRLAEVAAADSAERLNHIFAEIDYEVARITLEAQKLSKTPLMRTVEVATFTIGLLASILSNNVVVTSIAAATGSVTLLDSLRARQAKAQMRLDLQQDDFYFAYLLRRVSDEGIT